MYLNSLKQVNFNENFTYWLRCNESKSGSISRGKGHEIIGVIEPQKNETTPYTHYDHIADAQNEADVAIDFSNPNLLFPLLEEEFHYL